MATDIGLQVEKAAAHEVEEKLGADALIQAKNASDREHSQTFFQVLKANKAAAAWSMAISLSIIMEGYDTILMVSISFTGAHELTLLGQFLGLSRIRKEVRNILRS